MAYKLDVGSKGKTFHIEAEAVGLVGKKIGDTVKGEDVMSELAGAEFEITGASDNAGFPASEDVEGTGLNKELLTEGFALKAKHKKFKKSKPKPIKGLRLRRTLRGSTIGSDIVQINLKLVKEGDKSLAAMLGKEEGGEGKKKEEAKSAEDIQKEMQEMMAKAKGEEKPAEAQ